MIQSNLIRETISLTRYNQTTLRNSGVCASTRRALLSISGERRAAPPLHLVPVGTPFPFRPAPFLNPARQGNAKRTTPHSSSSPSAARGRSRPSPRRADGDGVLRAVRGRGAGRPDQPAARPRLRRPQLRLLPQGPFPSLVSVDWTLPPSRSSLTVGLRSLASSCWWRITASVRELRGGHHQGHLHHPQRDRRGAQGAQHRQPRPEGTLS
jgi:hypothetical protein